MSWRTSSFSGANGQCVEVDSDPKPEFKISSFCNAASCVEVAPCAGGDCVEILTDITNAVYVRDSKDRTGPVLNFTGEEWRAFILGVKAGEFDI